MPNSTVTIEANTGSTKINNLTVSTGSNVIIGEGVTVKNLIVGKGNVIFKNGLNGFDKNNTQNNTGTNLYLIDESRTSVYGASVGSSGTIFIGSKDWAEFAMIWDAAAVGGSYKMQNDATVTTYLWFSKGFNLDLNGHTITIADDKYIVMNSADTTTINLGEKGKIVGSTGFLVYVNANANGVIKGGEMENTTTTESNEAIYVQNNTSLRLEDTYIKATNCYGVVVYPNSSTTAKLTVKGKTKIDAKHFAITGNGTSGETTIDIQGGEFTSNNYAIYNPQIGKMTISGGKFTGNAGAIVNQRGTLEISGGEFISNGTYNPTIPASGDGTAGLRDAALCLSGRYGDLNVKITGGTFTAYGDATAVSATHNDKETTYTKTVEVSGATFSDLTLLTAGTDNFNVSGSFKLSSDISVDSLNIKGSKNVEVDLNSKIVTVKQDVKSSSAVTLSQKSDELVFKNGTITVPGSSSGKGALSIEKGRLILDNATFSAPDWSGAFFIQKADAYLEVRNQSHLYARAYGFTSNATTSNSELTYGSGAEIHLSDSYFNSTQTGFMMNVPVKVYIKNCEFSGNHQAAYLRGGEYEIENSTFKLNATLPTTDTEYRDNASTWGSGNAAPFAAVVIGNRASNAYQYPTTVTFKGTQSFGSVSDDEYKASYPALFIWGETGYPVTVKGDLTGFTANGYDYDAVIGGNVDVSGATLPSKVNDQREAASSSTTE
jgi:hypothetical protein